MKFRHLLLIIGLVFFSACSEYQQLIKSTDVDLKYKKAMEFYEAEDYVRASALFEELVSIYRGNERAESLTYCFADALFNLRDYITAGYYYEQLLNTFPNSKYGEECQFQLAYCKYKQSPKARLDQTVTEQAINEFQYFTNMYPASSRIPEANRLMVEMRDKLVYKSYLSARLYFDLGDYGGNNYLSAVIASQNSLKEFPDTKYREELSFLILEAKYLQALESVDEKREDRYRETIDEYHSFINDFADSKYLRKAEAIYTNSSRQISKK